MYTQTWNKYLPIVKILLKRSLTEEQVFSLNVSDFKQAGATRKIGYKFLIQFVNGRVENILTEDIAKDFASALMEEPATRALLQQNNYHISMNTKFQLTIKFISKIASEQDANEEVVTDVVEA